MKHRRKVKKSERSRKEILKDVISRSLVPNLNKHACQQAGKQSSMPSTVKQ